MKFYNMEREMGNYGFEYVIDKCILVSKSKQACLICGEPTEYIDVFSEAHFCSEECVKKFYQQLTKTRNEGR